jgi:adenylate cyclase
VRAGEQAIDLAIAIHYGPVLMGNIGGGTMFQFTVVGDTVNVASRLESSTRELSTPLVVSDDVVQRAKKADTRSIEGLVPVAPIALRGRQRPVAAWMLAVNAA